MKKEYLQEKKTMLLNDLFLREQLFAHLREIAEMAHCREEKLPYELLKRNSTPSKAINKMDWVQHMNLLKALGGRNSFSVVNL